MSAPSMLDVALWWAGMGYPVFPAIPGGSKVKHPFIGDNLNAASIDFDVIKAWWRRWPRAMIGLPMGARSDLACFDVDRHEGKPDGLATLRQLEADGFRLPPGCMVVDTPNAGIHHVFRLNGRLLATKTALWPGIDIRGQGSYIIAGGSRMSDGRTYQIREVDAHALAA